MPQIINPPSQPATPPTSPPVGQVGTHQPPLMGSPGAALMSMANGGQGYQPPPQPPAQPQPQFTPPPTQQYPQQPMFSTPASPVQTPFTQQDPHGQPGAYGAGAYPAVGPAQPQHAGGLSPTSPMTPLQVWQQQNQPQQPVFQQQPSPQQPPINQPAAQPQFPHGQQQQGQQGQPGQTNQQSGQQQPGQPGQQQSGDGSPDWMRQMLEADRDRAAELERLKRDYATMQQQLQQSQPQQPSQQQQQAAAAQFSFDNWPEVDPVLMNHYREARTDEKGNQIVTWKDGTPANVRAAGDAMMQRLDEWATSLLYQPHKVLPEMIRKYASEVAQQLVREQVTASENTLRLDHMLTANDWMFQQDPQSGRTVLSDYGRQVVGMAEFDPNKTPSVDDVRRLESALEVVRLKRENDQLRQQYAGQQQPVQYPGQQNQPNPLLQQQQQQSQELERQVGRFQQIAQRTQQGAYDPSRVAQNGVNRTGSFPQQNVNAPHAQMPQNAHLSPGTKLMQNMRYGTGVPSNGHYPAMAN